MTRNTEADLHALLDRLTDGEHVKATWKVGQVEVTAEGPVMVNGAVRCDRLIRWGSGSINDSLTSLEVAREEVVTVTRDDEEALHALLDSLEGVQEVTAEWRNKDGSMILTGSVQASGLLREVDGYVYGAMRLQDGVLHSALRYVTVRRTVVQRWERDGDE